MNGFLKSDFLMPAALGAGAIGAATMSVYSLAKGILGSREPKTKEEKVEERKWLADIVGDKDAAAVCADETARNTMFKLRMYRHFDPKAYRGLGKSLAAVVRVRRHLMGSRGRLDQGSPTRLQARYIAASRRALEDLMATLKAREGDPAENGYDEAAEIAESLSEWLETEYSNLAWATDRARDM